MIYYEKRGLKTLQKFKEVHIFLPSLVVCLFCF